MTPSTRTSRAASRPRSRRQVSPKAKRRRRRRQLKLAARTRGGYRAGAGRPKGRSKHYVPHVRRPEVTAKDVTHVTLSCVPGIPSLRRPVPYRLIREIFAAEGKRKGFRLAHYSVRRTHIHLVCEADSTQALSRGVQRVASRIARRLNKQFGRRGRFFADRYHAVVIKSPRQLRNVLRYVLLNERKDGLREGEVVDGLDPYTSYKWFDGWAHRKGEPRPPPPTARDPVTQPKSWLLRTGWRRHGLIRTDELPPAWLEGLG